MCLQSLGAIHPAPRDYIGNISCFSMSLQSAILAKAYAHEILSTLFGGGYSGTVSWACLLHPTLLILCRQRELKLYFFLPPKQY